MQDNSKGLLSNQMQQKMTQTFNLSILNNSFQVGNVKMNQTATMGGSTLDGSPRAIRSLMKESQSPFTVYPNAKIPDLSETRREERELRVQSLL